MSSAGQDSESTSRSRRRTLSKNSNKLLHSDSDGDSEHSAAAADHDYEEADDHEEGVAVGRHLQTPDTPDSSNTSHHDRSGSSRTRSPPSRPTASPPRKSRLTEREKEDVLSHPHKYVKQYVRESYSRERATVAEDTSFLQRLMDRIYDHLGWIVSFWAVLMAVYVGWSTVARGTPSANQFSATSSHSIEPTFPWKAFNEYKQGVKGLSSKGSLSDQASCVWTSLRASVSFLNSSAMPLQPSCVLLVGDQSAVDCMSLAAAQLFAKTTHTPFTLDEDFSDRAWRVEGASLDAAHAQLNSRLSSDFHSGRSHVVRLRGIQSLHDQVALPLLHALCENENALRKKALILLTVNTAQTVEDSCGQACENMAHSVLEGAWQGMEGDDLEALWSRIASYVICAQKVEKC